MNRRLAILRRHLGWTDALLAVAGVLGLVLYLWLLPGQHPDSAASYDLGEDRAAEIARAFSEENGVRLPDNARQQVTLDRHTALVDSLQRALTRPAATALLKTEAHERLPAYYWRVDWSEPGDDEADYDVDVRLTESGAVYAYDVEGQALLSEARLTLDRKALDYALSETQDVPDGTSGSRLTTVPDSLLPRLARRLSFRFVPPDTAAQNAAQEAEQEAAQNVSPVEAIDPLNQEEAGRLAQYHLRRTALKAYAFRVDSMWIESEGGDPRMATVRLWGNAFHGQRPRVDVRVAATGTLLGLDPDFNPEGDAPPAVTSANRDGAPVVVYRAPSADTAAAAQANAVSDAAEDEDNVNISFGSGTVMGVITGVLYVMLTLASVFVFFRRMNTRLVDTRTALRDALWGGLFAAAALGIPAFGGIAQEGLGDEFWYAVLGISVMVLFAGAGGAFLIFLASGAMDSVARARWAEKLTTLDLVRQGAVRNVPTGLTLLRGVAGAFVLLGGTTLLLVLLPEAVMHFSDQDASIGREMFISVFAFAAAVDGWVGFFTTLTVLLGVGTMLYRWKASAWLVVPGTALVLLLMQTTLVKVAPLSLNVVFAGFASLGIAGMFWRFDFMAAFTTYFVSMTTWLVTNGWMVAGSPNAPDAALAFGMTGLLVALGFVGLVSGRTSTEIPEYVPSYITELAEQERLKRDIEIAQEVQRSFLPRRMPQVEGLDLAAMCLPAQDVGGDYYDFVEVAPGRLAVVIGDVSGKGIQAAFYMTLTKGFLQTLAREARGPADVLRRLNDLFCQNAARGTFISMIYGVFDVEAGTFTFARAGHNPLIYKRSPNERPHFVQPKGMAIGLTQGAHFDESIEEKTVTLSDGDALIFYTDGFSEAMNGAGEQFGEDRMADRLDGMARQPAKHILRALSEAVSLHVQEAGRHDDMTMVVVKLDRRTNGTRKRAKHREAPTHPRREKAAKRTGMGGT